MAGELHRFHFKYYGVYMAKPTAVQKERFEHLFGLDLQFQWEMSPITSREAEEGEYIGSGDGTAIGSKIQGTVRWDLFEKQEENLCRSNLIGVIETHNGAQIRFDSRGFFIKPDLSRPNQWITSASVYFYTEDQRYEWLNIGLAVWEGEFDMGTYQHHYQVYFQVRE
jgi:hypothetical protein